MSTHSYHKKENGVILFDKCPRCLEHAKCFGLALDHELYIKMWNKMLDVEFNGKEYDSTVEQVLGKHMYKIALALERHTGINPKEMPWT